jgi:hypothetical protein
MRLTPCRFHHFHSPERGADALEVRYLLRIVSLNFILLLGVSSSTGGLFHSLPGPPQVLAHLESKFDQSFLRVAARFSDCVMRYTMQKLHARTHMRGVVSGRLSIFSVRLTCPCYPTFRTPYHTPNAS